MPCSLSITLQFDRRLDYCFRITSFKLHLICLGEWRWFACWIIWWCESQVLSQYINATTYGKHMEDHVTCFLKSKQPILRVAEKKSFMCVELISLHLLNCTHGSRLWKCTIDYVISGFYHNFYHCMKGRWHFDHCMKGRCRCCFFCPDEWFFCRKNLEHPHQCSVCQHMPV